MVLDIGCATDIFKGDMVKEDILTMYFYPWYSLKSQIKFPFEIGIDSLPRRGYFSMIFYQSTWSMEIWGHPPTKTK